MGDGNKTDIKSFDNVRKKYTYSRILMKINTLDHRKGQLLAVSDSTDSDDGLCEKMHEFLDSDMLCVIVGGYVQGGNQNVMNMLQGKGVGHKFCEEDFVANQSNTRYMNGVLKEGDGNKHADTYSIQFYEVKLKQFKNGTSIIMENISVWEGYKRTADFKSCG